MTKVEGERKDKLKHVKLSDIIFEGRAREDYGDLEELKASITDKGVIQPITLSSNLRLLAGGRRFTACSELGFTTIPAIVREVSDAIDELEVELIENLHRKDFTWQERARLTERIDAMKRAQNPTKWSQERTAETVGLSVGMTNKDLQLARAMKFLPELENCKTADDAFKIIKKTEEKILRQELRERQQQHVEKETPVTGIDAGVTRALLRADADYKVGNTFDGMKELRNAGNITIIECDPPYGIDLNNQKAAKDSVTSTVTGYKEVPADHYESFLDRLTTELYRIANKDCWLVFWYGHTWHAQVLESLRKAGWQVDEIPAIWVKPNGQTLQPELYYARCYEPFFLCRKGKPVMAERGRSNVFSFAGARDKYHPTQRPVELIEAILETLSVGMDTVFVPFLGSGATLRACYNRGIKCFGYDLDAKYKDDFMLAVEEDARKNYQG